MKLTDTDMRDALSQFMEIHRPLGATAQIKFVNEGVYTSVQRMRTLMPLCPYGKFPNASSLELRGEWRYPMMMLNDWESIPPDPPVIIVCNAAGSAIARFEPQSAEHIHSILKDEVFDIENMHQRQDEIEKDRLRSQRLEEKKEFLFRQRKQLDSKLRDIVETSAATCGQDLRAVAQRVLSRLRDHKERVYTDMDAYSEVSALQAFDGGLPKAARAISNEIGRLVYAELMMMAGADGLEKK